MSMEKIKQFLNPYLTGHSIRIILGMLLISSILAFMYYIKIMHDIEVSLLNDIIAQQEEKLKEYARNQVLLLNQQLPDATPVKEVTLKENVFRTTWDINVYHILSLVLVGGAFYFYPIHIDMTYIQNTLYTLAGNQETIMDMIKSLGGKKE